MMYSNLCLSFRETVPLIDTVGILDGGESPTAAKVRDGEFWRISQLFFRDKWRVFIQGSASSIVFARFLTS